MRVDEPTVTGLCECRDERRLWNMHMHDRVLAGDRRDPPLPPKIERTSGTEFVNLGASAPRALPIAPRFGRDDDIRLDPPHALLADELVHGAFGAADRHPPHDVEHAHALRPCDQAAVVTRPESSTGIPPAPSEVSTISIVCTTSRPISDDERGSTRSRTARQKSSI